MTKINHPALLQAENEKLREALRWYEETVAECRKIGSLGDNARQALDRDGGFRARDALSQQPEPTDAFTAVDMATAAAQGFRDGQAAMEPAPARSGDDMFGAHIISGVVATIDGREIGPGHVILSEDRYKTLLAAYVSQAEQQPEPAPTKDETEPVYQFQWREIGEGDWMACSHSWFRFCEASPEHDTRVVEVARPAQTAPQPQHSALVEALEFAVSEQFGDVPSQQPLSAWVVKAKAVLENYKARLAGK